MMRIRSCAAFGRSGFSSVELLVVVGLLALLVALVVPAIGLARRKADRIGCTGNLRQLAAGVKAYAQDHAKWLPPGERATHGLDRTHGPAYRDDAEHRYQLAYHLAPYLNLPKPDAQLRDCPSMRCPASERDAGGGAKAVGREMYAVATGAAVLAKPFGLRDQATPRRIDDVLVSFNPDELWMLTDVDLENDPGHVPPAGLAAKSVHGNTRNVAYFDGHVTPIPWSKATIDDTIYAK